MKPQRRRGKQREPFMEGVRPEIGEQMDGDPMHPPLRQKVHFAQILGFREAARSRGRQRRARPRSSASRKIARAPKKASVRARSRPSKRKSCPSRSARQGLRARQGAAGRVQRWSHPFRGPPDGRRIPLPSSVMSRINSARACSMGEKFSSAPTTARRERHGPTSERDDSSPPP